MSTNCIGFYDPPVPTASVQTESSAPTSSVSCTDCIGKRFALVQLIALVHIPNGVSARRGVRTARSLTHTVQRRSLSEQDGEGQGGQGRNAV